MERHIAFPLLFVGAVFVFVPPCDAAGGFENTGSLSIARYFHTATLLPNGRVLIAGGSVEKFETNSAELYDPESREWTSTGSLAFLRARHTALLLPNGKVLVVGGRNLFEFLTSAELYDPGSGMWTETGSLIGQRADHTATLLLNGKVLVVGGFYIDDIPGFHLLNTAELYDPPSGTWTWTGSLSIARHLHTATLLPSGKVLVAGGFGTDAETSAEVYDPESGTWTPTGSLVTGRGEHRATLLPNGKVLVVAGYDTASASAEL